MPRVPQLRVVLVLVRAAPVRPGPAVLASGVRPVSAPRVVLTPMGRAAVQVRDSSFPPGESRWIEVGFDYDMGGLFIQVLDDRTASECPEYGRPE